MARKVKPLSDTQCASAKPKGKEYFLYDGDGLALLIYPSGRKTWKYIYQDKITKKNSKLTLATYPELSLAKARELRLTYRTMLAEGKDPKEQKYLQTQQSDNQHTLKSITIAWLDAYAKKVGLEAETKHKRLRKFENHVFPVLKDRLIETIRLKELMVLLNGIYEKSPDNAQRIRADLISIYGYALQHGFIETNIARDLRDTLNLSSVKKHRATFKSLDEIPNLISGINTDTGHFLTKSCLKIILHTFLRSSEVRYARWSEIDFNKKEWRLPASRNLIQGIKYSNRGMKSKREHLVPLSQQVIEILKEIYMYSGNCDYIFPSIYNKKKFLSGEAPNDALRRMGYETDEICLHGFRALARSSLAEMSLFQKDALEKQMSHLEKNKTVGAYTHIAEYLEERRKIMSVWSDWLVEVETNSYISPHDYAQTKYVTNQSKVLELLAEV